MKRCYQISLLILLIFTTSFLTTGCRRSSDEVWDDTQTAGRYFGRGIKSMGGKHGESQQFRSADEFLGLERKQAQSEFIPLEDEEVYGRLTMGDTSALKEIEDTYPQPSESPGDEGSRIPGIDGFVNPNEDPGLRNIFKTVYFPYNSSIIKGEENITRVQNIAAYLKRHPNTYIFIEGHCDERGAREYNLALGVRRANAVRGMLIKMGVDLERLFTISYGKEKPAVVGNDESAWSKNRRGEFKVFSR